MNGKIGVLIGALIFLSMLAGMGATFFTGLNITGAPSWMATVLPIVVAGGLVMAVWKLFR